MSLSCDRQRVLFQMLITVSNRLRQSCPCSRNYPLSQLLSLRFLFLYFSDVWKRGLALVSIYEKLNCTVRLAMHLRCGCIFNDRLPNSGLTDTYFTVADGRPRKPTLSLYAWVHPCSRPLQNPVYHCRLVLEMDRTSTTVEWYYVLWPHWTRYKMTAKVAKVARAMTNAMKCCWCWCVFCRQQLRAGECPGAGISNRLLLRWILRPVRLSSRSGMCQAYNAFLFLFHLSAVVV